VFRQRYPKVNVTVHDVINEQVLELVRHRRVELGIGFEPDNIEGWTSTRCTWTASSRWCPPTRPWHCCPR
jgi:DNA-binding transcriptional LysR family regulator